MPYVTREFYHRASSTDEGLDTRAWLKSHKYITEGTPFKRACTRLPPSGFWVLHSSLRGKQKRCREEDRLCRDRWLPGWGNWAWQLWGKKK